MKTRSCCRESSKFALIWLVHVLSTHRLIETPLVPTTTPAALIVSIAIMHLSSPGHVSCHSSTIGFPRPQSPSGTLPTELLSAPFVVEILLSNHNRTTLHCNVHCLVSSPRNSASALRVSIAGAHLADHRLSTTPSSRFTSALSLRSPSQTQSLPQPYHRCLPRMTSLNHQLTLSRLSPCTGRLQICLSPTQATAIIILTTSHSIQQVRRTISTSSLLLRRLLSM
jgi:hypothetical protein